MVIKINKPSDVTEEVLGKIIEMHEAGPVVDVPMSFDERCDLARQTVAKLDKIDGGDRELRTIYLALECGCKDPRTNAHFDALIMLEELLKKG